LASCLALAFGSVFLRSAFFNCLALSAAALASAFFLAFSSFFSFLAFLAAALATFLASFA
jgi:hypothetical protein